MCTFFIYVYIQEEVYTQTMEGIHFLTCVHDNSKKSAVAPAMESFVAGGNA